MLTKKNGTVVRLIRYKGDKMICLGALFTCFAVICLLVGIVSFICGLASESRGYLSELLDVVLGIVFLCLGGLFVALVQGHVHGDYHNKQMQQWEVEKAIVKHYNIPDCKGCKDD